VSGLINHLSNFGPIRHLQLDPSEVITCAQESVYGYRPNQYIDPRWHSLILALTNKMTMKRAPKKIMEDRVDCQPDQGVYVHRQYAQDSGQEQFICNNR
jgi:hypothetical protein